MISKICQNIIEFRNLKFYNKTGKGTIDMKIEETVKMIILKEYGTLKDFSEHIGLPYSTVYALFKRGFSNSTVDNVLAVCEALNLSADSLAEGHIKIKEETVTKAPNDLKELEEALKEIIDSANTDRIINSSECNLLKNNMEAVLLLIKQERNLKA